MAGTTAPLFGLGASGTIGKAITFSSWRGRTYVRKRVVPANPKSGLQVGMRAGFKFVTQIWGTLTTAQKADWADLAAADNITNLNADVRYNQQRLRQGNLPVRTTGEDAGTTPAKPTIALAAGYRQLTVTITAGADAPEFDWAIYGSKTTGFTPGADNLLAIIPAATLTYVITGLDSGVEYYVVVNGGNYNGEAGTPSDEGSETPT